jgi:hypothetical protein
MDRPALQGSIDMGLKITFGVLGSPRVRSRGSSDMIMKLRVSYKAVCFFEDLYKNQILEEKFTARK